MGRDGPGAPGGDGPASIQDPLPFHVEQWHYRSGPLPDSKELAGYEAVQSGLADRIVAMAEETLDAQNKVTRWAGAAESISVMVASVATSMAPIGLIVAAVLLARSGADAAALISAVGAGVSVGPKLVEELRKKKS